MKQVCTISKVFLFLISFSAWGKTELGTAWKAPIDTLISQGIRKIGKVDLEYVRTQGSRIRWETVKGKLSCPNADERSSACFKKSTNTLQVSEALVRRLGGSLGMFELHEILDATLNIDHDYGPSTSIFLLYEMPDSAVRRDIKKKLENGVFQKVARCGGSGSAVCGGGDHTSFAIKHEVLRQVVRGGANVTAEFLAEFPKIKFEPLYEANQQIVGIRYKTTRRPRSESITIYVPARLWAQNNSRVKKSIVKDIVEKVTSLFPAYERSAKTHMVGLTCSANSAMPFPKAQEAEILAMQEARVAYLTGCDEPLYLAEIRYPSFESAQDRRELREQIVEQAGPGNSSRIRSWDCAWSYGGLRSNTVVSFLIGQVGRSIFATPSAYKSRNIDSNLIVQVYSNLNGEIDIMTVDVLESGTDRFLFRKVRKFSGQRRPSLQERISWLRLKVQCKPLEAIR